MGHNLMDRGITTPCSIKTVPLVILSYLCSYSYELHDNFQKYIGYIACCEYGMHVCGSFNFVITKRFSVNKIIYKIFGAMGKDSYGQISEYFGIPSVQQLITNRHKIGVQKITYVKHCSRSLSSTVCNIFRISCLLVFISFFFCS